MMDINEEFSGKMFILRGPISNYTTERKSAHFFFSNADQSTAGGLAIGAAAMGLSGQAGSGVVMSSDMEELADRVSFHLGEHAIQGWLSRSPFVQGDEVAVLVRKSVQGWSDEIAALESKEPHHWEALAVLRPLDRVIALPPHLSRGRRALVVTATKWWLGLTTVLVLIMLPLMTPDESIFSSKTWTGAFSPAFFMLGAYAFGLIIAIDMVRRLWKFSRRAEKVFAAFGWNDVAKVDLIKSTKAQLTRFDPPELGVFYFKYPAAESFSAGVKSSKG